MTLFAVAPAGTARVDERTGLALPPKVPAGDQAWFKQLVAEPHGPVRRALVVEADVPASEHRRSTAASLGDYILTSLERSRNSAPIGANLVDRGTTVEQVGAAAQTRLNQVQARLEAVRMDLQERLDAIQARVQSSLQRGQDRLEEGQARLERLRERLRRTSSVPTEAVPWAPSPPETKVVERVETLPATLLPADILARIRAAAADPSATPILEVHAEASGPSATATATAKAVVDGQVVEKTATDRSGDGGPPDTPGSSSSFSYAVGIVVRP